MKKIILIALVFLGLKNHAQSTIVFTYDGAGNMIERKVQITINARLGNFEKDSSEVAPPLNFNIYPNPTQTYVNIEGSLPENVKEATWQIQNTAGQLLKSGIYNGILTQINVQDLKSGVYPLVIMYNKKQKSTYKIIVTN